MKLVLLKYMDKLLSSTQQTAGMLSDKAQTIRDILQFR